MARQRHDPLKDLVGFLLGDVMYAVRIEVVREVVNPLPIVELPRAPASVKGVSDYRGEVVPVIDLRERFGLPSVQASRRTKWVVLDVASGPSTRSAPHPQRRTVEPATFGESLRDSDGPPRMTGFAEMGGAALATARQNVRGPNGTAPEGARPTPVVIKEAGGSYAALVVDSVTEVFGLGGGGLRPAPPLGEGDEQRGIEGVTTFGSRLVFVLDARAFGPVARAALSWAPGLARSLENS